MGMAASQARLLSITSRMADNELRSQLINNAKMRLATDSSRASEEYIAALNKTQLMITNYDLRGEKQHVDLNFTNLTMYSPLNNQYGLVNKSGQLLVSELDTARYETAFQKAKEDKEIEEGDTEGLNAKALEEFLKQYGLVKDTTYFEQDKVYEFNKDMQRIYEGDMVYEYHPATDTTKPEAIRVSGLHYGYEKSKTSVEYGVYEALLDDYKTKDSAYTKAVKQEMKDFVSNLKDGNGTKYEDIYKQLMADAASEDTDGDGIGDALKANYTKYHDAMKTMWNSVPAKLKQGDASGENSAEVFKAQMEDYLKMEVGGVLREETTPAPNRGSLADYIAAGATIDYKNHKIITWHNDPDSEDENGNPILPVKDNTNADLDGLGSEWTEVIESTISEEDMINAVQQMFTYFQSGIMYALDRNKFTNTDETKEARKEYHDAAKKLSQFIYGQDIGVQFYDNLDDMEWILYGDFIDPTDPTKGRTNAPYFPTTALDPTEGGVAGEYVDVNDKINGEEVTNKYYCNFQAIKDVYLCDKMMDLYGTPKYTWIDENNPDENAEAKAKWYTNLFQRMLDGGYKTLEKGLANSQEWLQFALESSLISMEQVNKDNTWVSTMYSNCSDITESTVDVDITIAEAKYTKTMNQIQAKDKRYDIELKNIDTEHNSLQTEYDSIKSVMDKNVERNFKMFQA